MRYRIPLALLVLVCLAVPAAAVPEAPIELTAEQVAKAVDKAPKLPVDLELDLPLKLVDYIDFTNPKDPHPLIDQGTSKITKGKAGEYRVTAAHRHAFFASRWRAAEKDAPHVVVVEYPDDAQRSICFFTHESALSGRANIDWSLETGVYTGNPLPTTGKMQYHTMFFWPNDAHPVIMIANWIRSGAPAAASRVWVYQVEGGKLPALKVDEPDPGKPRMIGDLYNWAKVPVEGIFGLTSKPTAFEHIAEYYAYLGNNLVAWPVVSNNRWGFKCLIDAWDGEEKMDWLTPMLAAGQANGVKFLATFDFGRGFKINGKTAADDPSAFRQGLLDGFTQFIETYGQNPALYGIAFGTPDFGPRYGDATWDIIGEVFDGDFAAFTNFIHEKRPDLKIYTFVGARDLHKQYFDDAPGVMARWEAAGGDWDQHLADEVTALWKTWDRDQAKLAKVPHLTTIYQYQVDDHAIYDTYSQQGRSMVYYDVDTSRPKSNNINTRSVMLWNTFFEGWFGLHPEVNFWYRKLWVAPDFNAAEPYASAPWARAMEHRDREFIIAGAWNRKAGGHEASLRKFAKALRSLPPVEMAEVAVGDDSPVLVRQAVFQGKTYVSVLNTTPFEAKAEVKLGDKSQKLTLAPYAMETVLAAGDRPVQAKSKASRTYTKWLEKRLARYNKLLAEVAKLDPAAAPQPYADHADRAATLFKAGKYRQADLALGFGLPAELAMRKRVLAPPVTKVPKFAGDLPLGGDLDEWPASKATIKAVDGSFIGSHLYFANSWAGPEDLSAVVRMLHNGKHLYIGMEVLDSKLTDLDALTFMFSPQRYRKPLITEAGQNHYEINYPVTLPTGEKKLEFTRSKGFNAAARRTDNGYVVTAALDITTPEFASGKFGWIIQLGDHEKAPGTKRATWAKETIMLIPHAPVQAYWSDARTCGELVLE